MRVVKVLFWVAVVASATLFYALNIDNGVELDFHFWRSPPTTPVSIVVTVALVIGVAVSTLVGLFEFRTLKKKKRLADARLVELEKEVDALKARLADSAVEAGSSPEDTEV